MELDTESDRTFCSSLGFATFEKCCMNVYNSQRSSNPMNEMLICSQRSITDEVIKNLTLENINIGGGGQYFQKHLLLHIR